MRIYFRALTLTILPVIRRRYIPKFIYQLESLAMKVSRKIRPKGIKMTKMKLLQRFILDLRQKKANQNLKLVKYSKVGFKLFLSLTQCIRVLRTLGPRAVQIDLNGKKVLHEKKGWYSARSRLTGEIGDVPSNYFCSGEYISY